MKRILTLLTLVVMMGACYIFNTNNIQAASKKTKAMNAYKEFLAAETIEWDGSEYDASELEFLTADIDGDKVPELVISYYATEKIYTYKNNKVKHVLQGDIVIYPKEHIVTNSKLDDDGVKLDFYKITKGKAKKFATFAMYYEKGKKKFSYKINGKKVSGNKFDKKIKTTKALKMKFYSNTAAKREKVLK